MISSSSSLNSPIRVRFATLESPAADALRFQFTAGWSRSEPRLLCSEHRRFLPPSLSPASLSVRRTVSSISASVISKRVTFIIAAETKIKNLEIRNPNPVFRWGIESKRIHFDDRIHFVNMKTKRYENSHLIRGSKYSLNFKRLFTPVLLNFFWKSLAKSFLIILRTESLPSTPPTDASCEICKDKLKLNYSLKPFSIFIIISNVHSLTQQTNQFEFRVCKNRSLIYCIRRIIAMHILFTIIMQIAKD